MRRSDAITLTREMQRYSTISCHHPQVGGSYVRQALIAKCKPWEYDACVGKLHWPKNKYYEIRTVVVPISRFISFQDGLNYRALRWQLRHRCRVMPDVVRLKSGRYMVWNGNHRITVAILLGRTSVRCTLLKGPL